MNQIQNKMNSCSDSNPETSSNNDDGGSNHFARLEDYSSVAENDIDIEEDEDDENLNDAASSLPRPPTKPNVHIEDLTICPVCTQAGKIRLFDLIDLSQNLVKLNVQLTSSLT